MPVRDRSTRYDHGRRTAGARILPVTHVYEIRLREHLDSRWANCLDGIALSYREDGTTLLVGPVRDQAALHGLLARVRDLGLTLLSVTCLGPAQGRTSVPADGVRAGDEPPAES
jgi:hypothetical protein